MTRIEGPPFQVTDNHKIRPQFRALANGSSVNKVFEGDLGALEDLSAGSSNSDGLVSVDSARFGKHFEVLSALRSRRHHRGSARD